VILKNFFIKFWSARIEFIKYFVIGCSAFVLDVTSLFLLKEKANISPVAAVAITQPFLIGYVFFLNKKWSFRSLGVMSTQFIKFSLLVVFNYSFSIFWMWIISRQLHVNYIVTRLINVMLSTSWNFLLYKHWVYKTTE
jgi:putative flippase GtrA